MDAVPPPHSRGEDEHDAPQPPSAEENQHNAPPTREPEEEAEEKAEEEAEENATPSTIPEWVQKGAPVPQSFQDLLNCTPDSMLRCRKQTKCSHDNLTKQGTNYFQARIKCKNCGELLAFYDHEKVKVNAASA